MEVVAPFANESQRQPTIITLDVAAGFGVLCDNFIVSGIDGVHRDFYLHQNHILESPFVPVLRKHEKSAPEGEL